jgi:hypothetical protein
MKILTKSHKYELENFEHPEKPGQVIQFIEKHYDGCGDPLPSTTTTDGTTNEELLRVMIDRMRGLNEKMPCRQNSIAITKLEEAAMWLNDRTEERRSRNVEGTMKL